MSATDLRVADPDPIGSEPFWSDPESDPDPTQKNVIKREKKSNKLSRYLFFKSHV